MRPYITHFTTVLYKINENLVTGKDKTDMKFFCPTDNSEFSKNLSLFIAKIWRSFQNLKDTCAIFRISEINILGIKGQEKYKCKFLFRLLGYNETDESVPPICQCSLLSRLVN